MFKFCPNCAGQKITFNGTKFSCPDCGFTYYHNIAAAMGVILESAGKLLFLVRGKEPALGKLDLAGGFVSLGEGILEGLRRECIEEIGVDLAAIPGGLASVKLFASFPNVYLYKNISYNTCDCFFYAHIAELEAEKLKLQADEIGGYKLYTIEETKAHLDDFAFPSTRKAVQAYLSTFNS
jgi:ADP-ribose pyrophosphatase YjhB (NUDIX family)